MLRQLFGFYWFSHATKFFSKFVPVTDSLTSPLDDVFQEEPVYRVRVQKQVVNDEVY